MTEDIILMLESHGVKVGIEYSGNYKVLRTTGFMGNNPVIIPLEAFYDTVRQAAEASESLQKIIDKISPRPVIVARDRWECEREAIEKRLLAHCGIFDKIFARNCDVKRIEKTAARDFTGKYHSYGAAKSRYCYGLYARRRTGANESTLTGELVAVAEFSNARRWIKSGKEIKSYEWIRYSSIPQTRVVGGMGKLLEAFIEDVHPDDIMSYADLEWSDGSVYRQLGFSTDGRKPPVTFGIDKSTWKRTPLAKMQDYSPDTGYFMNLGSLKYRMKVTEY